MLNYEEGFRQEMYASIFNYSLNKELISVFTEKMREEMSEAVFVLCALCVKEIIIPQVMKENQSKLLDVYSVKCSANFSVKIKQIFKYLYSN